MASVEPQVEVTATADLPAGVLRRVRALLDDAFDGGFPADDWEHALGGWHAIVTVDGEPVAHAAVVPRELDIGGRRLRSGYVEAVATLPGAQRAGHGTRAMRALMGVIRREFDIGVLSTGVPCFYERLGWERWRGPTFVVRDGRRERTADEDDGIMVLRSGRSLEVALTDPIACQARGGDDW